MINIDLIGLYFYLNSGDASPPASTPTVAACTATAIGSYNVGDTAPNIHVPEFRPEFPPGLCLPQDKTRGDSQNYLTPGQLIFKKNL